MFNELVLAEEHHSTIMHAVQILCKPRSNPLNLQVLSDHLRRDVMKHVHGSIYKHPLLLVDPTTVQIMLYYDVEVVNPLGSKTSKYNFGINATLL